MEVVCDPIHIVILEINLYANQKTGNINSSRKTANKILKIPNMNTFIVQLQYGVMNKCQNNFLLV